MGEYLELYGSLSGTEDITRTGLEVNIFPNPTNGNTNIVLNIPETDDIVLSLFDINGCLVKIIDEGEKLKGAYYYQIDLSQQHSGVFFLSIQTRKEKHIQKIIRID
jgi:hypothetical protein